MRQPSEAEVLRAAMEAATKTVMTSLPGKVVSYDPATKLATIEPMVHNGNPLPPIPEVPVKFPRGGGYRLVWPLNPGDEVTLHFHKWDPSRFRVSGENSQSNLVRDGGVYPVAIPGSESETSTYTAAGTNTLHMGKDDGAVEIVVSATQIKLGSTSAANGVAKGNVSDDNFDAIVNWLTSHTHTVATAGSATAQTGTAAASSLPAPTINPTESTKVLTE